MKIDSEDFEWKVRHYFSDFDSEIILKFLLSCKIKNEEQAIQLDIPGQNAIEWEDLKLIMINGKGQIKNEL